MHSLSLSQTVAPAPQYDQSGALRSLCKTLEFGPITAKETGQRDPRICLCLPRGRLPRHHVWVVSSSQSMAGNRNDSQQTRHSPRLPMAAIDGALRGLPPGKGEKGSVRGCQRHSQGRARRGHRVGAAYPQATSASKEFSDAKDTKSMGVRSDPAGEVVEEDRARDAVCAVEQSEVATWQRAIHEQGYVVLPQVVPTSVVDHLATNSPHRSEDRGNISQSRDQRGSAIAPAKSVVLPERLGRVLDAVIGTNGTGRDAGDWRIWASNQRQGFRCTDGAISPDPSWDNTWQFAQPPASEAGDVEGAWGTAVVVLTGTDLGGGDMNGGLAVFPRSHWLVHDWWLHQESRQQLENFPLPEDVPSAAPVQVRMRVGDAVVMHPWLAWALTPNCCPKTTQLIFCQFRLETSSILPDGAPEESARQAVIGGTFQTRDPPMGAMWRHFPAMAPLLLAGLTPLPEEPSLLEEEQKASWGQWATTSVSSNFLASAQELPFRCTYVTQRDLLAWHLRTGARRLIAEERWAEALPLLRRLVGLRPAAYWAFYQAGVCSAESAPEGQLAGRAGRKCLLEDGERFLHRAMELAPGWPPPYAALAGTLVAMGRGREKEVGPLVGALLQTSGLDATCQTHPEAAAAVSECLQWVRNSLRLA